MEFSQNNDIVKLCLQGIAMEKKCMPEEAAKQFLQAWNEATDDHEKFIAAHYVARHQENAADRLRWLETDLELALKIHDDTVKSALPSLYSNIAECHEKLSDSVAAKKNYELAASCSTEPSDEGPFYHGTKADLRIGDLLTAGNESNYRPELKMNHVYFTALAHGAWLAAALAKGDGRERVYVVEPTGSFENDPNVTNNYFPGNPTRSYRTHASLRIAGEITDRVGPSSEEIQKWRDRLAGNTGDIIN
ncbi:MAG TPA: NAD(+)--rifampin ADP-ribosyltransferase [Candidatus Binatia bacterium]|nr:NAD(+)--rifampin ADP-ribosyltransferase [Candidatus Binatia bacterium]